MRSLLIIMSIMFSFGLSAKTISPEIIKYCEKNGYVIAGNTLNLHGSSRSIPRIEILEGYSLSYLYNMKNKYQNSRLEYDYEYDNGFFSRGSLIIVKYKADNGAGRAAGTKLKPSPPIHTSCSDILSFLISKDHIKSIDIAIQRKKAYTDRAMQARLEAKKTKAEAQKKTKAEALKKAEEKLAYQKIQAELEAKWKLQAKQKAQDKREAQEHLAKLESQARKKNMAIKNAAIKELKAQQLVFVAEMNRINDIFQSHAPKKVQVIISQRREDGTMLGTVNGELAGVQDFHSVINNAGVYQLEVVKLTNTLSRKLNNGFTQTIPVYGVSTKGQTEYAEWKKTAESGDLTKQYNAANVSSIELLEQIDELRRGK